MADGKQNEDENENENENRNEKTLIERYGECSDLLWQDFNELKNDFRAILTHQQTELLQEAQWTLKQITIKKHEIDQLILKVDALQGAQYKTQRKSLVQDLLQLIGQFDELQKHTQAMKDAFLYFSQLIE